MGTMLDDSVWRWELRAGLGYEPCWSPKSPGRYLCTSGWVGRDRKSSLRLTLDPTPYTRRQRQAQTTMRSSISLDHSFEECCSWRFANDIANCQILVVGGKTARVRAWPLALSHGQASTWRLLVKPYPPVWLWLGPRDS